MNPVNLELAVNVSSSRRESHCSRVWRSLSGSEFTSLQSSWCWSIRCSLVVWYSLTHLQCCTDSTLSLWRLASLNSLRADLLWRHCRKTQLFFPYCWSQRWVRAAAAQVLTFCESCLHLSTFSWSFFCWSAVTEASPLQLASLVDASFSSLQAMWYDFLAASSCRGEDEMNKWGTCGGKKHFCTNTCTCEKHTQKSAPSQTAANYFLAKSDILFRLGDSTKQRYSVHQHIKQGNNHNNISDSAAWEIIFYFSTDFLFFLQ